MPTFEAPTPYCKRDCSTCVTQYQGAAFHADPDMRKRTRVSNAHAQATLDNRMGFIRSNHSYLRQNLAQYGNAILRKWKKMSSAKREALLLQVEPGFCRKEWINQRLKYGLHDSKSSEEHLGLAVTLPYFNIEALKDDPMRLLSLLHNRTICEVESWTMFDVGEILYPWNVGTLISEDNDMAVMVHGHEYGQLCEWTPEQCHSWKAVGYPLARLIFNAQNNLFELMRRIVDLLHDPETSKVGNNEWAALVVKGFKTTGEVEFWSPYTNQAFSRAPIFDPVECLQQPTAQFRAALDHLQFLQTDPAYMHHLIRRHLSNFGGEAYKDPKSTDLAWTIMANDILVVPMLNARHLRYVVQECAHLCGLLKRSGTMGARFLESSPEVQKVATEVHYLCVNLYRIEREALGLVLCQSPGFSNNWERCKSSEGKVGYKLRNLGPGGSGTVMKNMFQLDPLHWALMCLLEDPEHMLKPKPPLLFAFIDKYLAKGTHADRQRINQELHNHLTLMSVYGGLENQFTLWGCRPINIAGPDTGSGRSAWRTIRQKPRDLTDTQRQKLSALLQDFYTHPPPSGTRDQKWLDNMAKSRQSLAAFWAQARDMYRGLEDGRFPEDVMNAELQLLSADLSSEYKNQVEEERQDVLQRLTAKAKQARVGNIPKGMPTQSLWGANDDQKLKPVIRQIKEKTRPQNDAADVETEALGLDDLHIEEQTTGAPRVAVNANSLRLFQKMFPASGEDTKGTVRWQDLVTAMADAGFVATRAGGSAVSFGNAHEEGSIVFHKPHQDPVVDAIMLQIMGKRMGKWFGWERDTFSERAKQA